MTTRKTAYANTSTAAGTRDVSGMRDVIRAAALDPLPSTPLCATMPQNLGHRQSREISIAVAKRSLPPSRRGQINPRNHSHVYLYYHRTLYPWFTASGDSPRMFPGRHSHIEILSLAGPCNRLNVSRGHRVRTSLQIRRP